MSRARQLLSLFRVFLPSWKFFDEVGSLPELSYLLESEKPSWQPVLIKPKTKLHNFFLHPESNLYHACGSLVERLLREAMESGETSDQESESSSPALENTVSYQLVENLVRLRIRHENPTAVGQKFQFKISIIHPSPTDVIFSRIHEV